MNPVDTYKVIDVFTPTKPARSTFVERESVNDKLVAALRTPGKQIVIYGHSGSGKTTLLVNKLHQIYESHIITRCFLGLTFEQLVLDAFDGLDPFYKAEKSDSRKGNISGSLQSEYFGIKGKIGAEASSEHQVKQVRVLPPQLTPQTLAKFLGEAKCCWVLEDFHKIGSHEKRKLAQVMKVFMDMSDSYNELKLIAIGAVDTARQVVEYDAEMRTRVSEIFVPKMTEEEINEIPDKGEELLNINFPPDVKERIVKFSDGLPSVCHQLCLNMCFADDIYQTSKHTVELNEIIFGKALEQYIEESSDTLKAAFDKALRKATEQKYNDGALILQALLMCDADGATREEIFSKIKLQEPSYSILQMNSFLRKLQTARRGELLRHDHASGRYSFAENIYRAYASTFFERARQKERKKITREYGVDNEALLRQVNKLLSELLK